VSDPQVQGIGGEKAQYAKIWTHETGSKAQQIDKLTYDKLVETKGGDVYLFINDLDNKVYWDKQEVKLQPKTRRFLTHLLIHYRRVYTWEKMEEDWKAVVARNAWRRQKRKIVEAIPSLSPFIVAEPGEGYKVAGDLSFCVISVR
jgi:hypothetical protein